MEKDKCLIAIMVCISIALMILFLFGCVSSDMPTEGTKPEIGKVTTPPSGYTEYKNRKE